MPQSKTAAAVLSAVPFVEPAPDAPDEPTPVWVGKTPGSDAHTSKDAEPMQKGLVKRRNGRVRRKRGVYMPPDLDKRLAVYCAANGREVSETVAAAVELYLDKRGA